VAQASPAHRLFFALWPTATVRDHIAREIAPVLLGQKARVVPPVNYHVTLAFVGSVPAARLGDALRVGAQIQTAPFEFQLTRAEVWRRTGILGLMIEPTPAPMAALVETLRAGLAAQRVTTDFKEFRAHVTLARDWHVDLSDARIAPISWSAQEFMLVESRPAPHGSQYEVIQRWPLRCITAQTGQK